MDQNSRRDIQQFTIWYRIRRSRYYPPKENVPMHLVCLALFFYYIDISRQVWPDKITHVLFIWAMGYLYECLVDNQNKNLLNIGVLSLTNRYTIHPGAAVSIKALTTWLSGSKSRDIIRQPATTNRHHTFDIRLLKYCNSTLNGRQMDTTLHTIYQNGFFKWKLLYFDAKCTAICSKGADWQYACVVLNTG